MFPKGTIVQNSEGKFKIITAEQNQKGWRYKVEIISLVNHTSAHLKYFARDERIRILEIPTEKASTLSRVDE